MEVKLVNAINCAMYASPIGTIKLTEQNGLITAVEFKEELIDTASQNYSSLIFEEASRQLEDYFIGNRTTFDLPLAVKGTAFQQKVWHELQLIPFGHTITYQHLAIRLGNLKAIRAAASANGKNPLAIIIPCHRVVGANGKLTGYAGGLTRKQWLLEHEAQVAGKSTLLF